jgi:hypothetical protein
MDLNLKEIERKLEELRLGQETLAAMARLHYIVASKPQFQRLQIGVNTIPMPLWRRNMIQAILDHARQAMTAGDYASGHDAMEEVDTLLQKVQGI